MDQYNESEQNAIDDKKKRLHYESIRVEEDRKEYAGVKEELDKQMQKIEDLVYDDSKEHQTEKCRLD